MPFAPRTTRRMPFKPLIHPLAAGPRRSLPSSDRGVPGTPLKRTGVAPQLLHPLLHCATMRSSYPSYWSPLWAPQGVWWLLIPKRPSLLPAPQWHCGVPRRSATWGVGRGVVPAGLPLPRMTVGRVTRIVRAGCHGVTVGRWTVRPYSLLRPPLLPLLPSIQSVVFRRPPLAPPPLIPLPTSILLWLRRSAVLTPRPRLRCGRGRGRVRGPHAHGRRPDYRICWHRRGRSPGPLSLRRPARRLARLAGITGLVTRPASWWPFGKCPCKSPSYERSALRCALRGRLLCVLRCAALTVPGGLPVLRMAARAPQPGGGAAPRLCPMLPLRWLRTGYSGCWMPTTADRP